MKIVAGRIAGRRVNELSNARKLNACNAHKAWWNMGLRSGCFRGRREAAAPGGSTTMSRLPQPMRDADTQAYRRETARDSRIAESGGGVNDIDGEPSELSGRGRGGYRCGGRGDGADVKGGILQRAGW